jgi:hypothetical protein
MTAGRQTVREQLALALVNYMSSAQSIYDHKPAKLKGSPAVMILSAGTDRSNRASTAGFGSDFYIEIHNLVRYADPAKNWTEKDGENALDQLELELATFMDVKANTKTSNWKSIRYTGRSVIGRAIIGGETYQDEIIPLRVIVSG